VKEKYPVVGAYTRLLDMSLNKIYGVEVNRSSQRVARMLWTQMFPEERAEAYKRWELINGEKQAS
jgi:hypothetical protein